MQGIWPECADGTDVNSVCRNFGGNILASADDFGMVKLFKYPVYSERAAFNQYLGHSSHVTKVKFTKGDR